MARLQALLPAWLTLANMVAPCPVQACTVDGFEVPFGHVGNRLTVEVPQVGSLHAGRSEQQLVISF